jgi:ribosome-binding protein aMBF1 (putative translation factor)
MRDGRCSPEWVDCPTCGGTGRITEQRLGWWYEGRAMSEERKSRGVSLREEAGRLGIKPSKLSDMEHGRVKPVRP